MSGTTVNDVTLFSNGIGHFRRTYQIVKGDEKITIPFKTDFIGDVAASLQVFGKVRLTEPPSFTPANANSTSLNIDQQCATASLLTQLSGAQFTLTKLNGTSFEGCVLLGTETQKVHCSDGLAEKRFVVYMLDGKIERLALDNITSIEFSDETVRTEIQKALKANFQQIKPDSTLVDLTISAEEDTEATVQYTIPVAAWKMRYAIRENDGKFTLNGAAIIDNNTDEDWNNFRISVVTGNPISFNTDIAEVVVPTRKMVRLVDGVALGNVDVQEGIMRGGGQPQAPRARSRALGAKMSVANYADFGAESIECCAAGAADMEQYYQAEAPEIESKEVGDFCVFTSKEPLTILARKSAVVSMFTTNLEHAGVVLLYKEQNHARRPYRAIKFRNETKDTLGRGKTVIYNEGVFSGECVLDTAKPGENRMLPHCLENGMKIIKRVGQHDVTRTSLQFSDGVAINETLRVVATTYRVENKKDESFKLALEHDNVLDENPQVSFEGVKVAEQEQLSHGWRVYLEVKPKEEFTLTVSESLLGYQNIRMADLGYIQSCVQDGIPLKEHPIIQECMKLQANIDEIEHQLQDLNNRRQSLTDQADRVRSNLAASGSNPDWVKDLGDTENNIREADEQIPQIRKKLRDLTQQLREKMKTIDLTWSAE